MKKFAVQWLLLPLALAIILIHNHWARIFPPSRPHVSFAQALEITSLAGGRDVYYKCDDDSDHCKWEGAKRECETDNFMVVGWDLSDDLTTRTYHARCFVSDKHPELPPKP